MAELRFVQKDVIKDLRKVPPYTVKAWHYYEGNRQKVEEQAFYDLFGFRDVDLNEVLDLIEKEPEKYDTDEMNAMLSFILRQFANSGYFDDSDNKGEDVEDDDFDYEDI